MARGGAWAGAELTGRGGAYEPGLNPAPEAAAVAFPPRRRATPVPQPLALGGRGVGGGGTRFRVTGGVGTRRGGPASLSAPVHCPGLSRRRQPPRLGVTQTWPRSPASQPSSPRCPPRFVPPAALTGWRVSEEPARRADRDLRHLGPRAGVREAAGCSDPE